jgi:hypothetical protein
MPDESRTHFLSSSRVPGNAFDFTPSTSSRMSEVGSFDDVSPKSRGVPGPCPPWPESRRTGSIGVETRSQG